MPSKVAKKKTPSPAKASPEGSDLAHVASVRATIARARAEQVPLQALTKPEQKAKGGDA